MADHPGVVPAEAAVTDSIEVGCGLTYGLAVVGDRLYVLNGSHDFGRNGYVRMVDTSTGAIAGTIEVGSMPFALAVGGSRLYVGNAGDGTVAVIDIATNQPVETVGVGIAPGLTAATPDGRTIYVADVMTGTVQVITSVHPDGRGPGAPAPSWPLAE